MNTPLLSICIRSYNQAAYISEAIDSALMQKTDFPFEIIIGEDCSTDNTPNILSDYISKFPDKIKIISGSENVGGTLNLKRTIEASSAKYIALCDGDDYWTDPYKLQKQVDFLENHPEYVVCFHNVMNIYEDKRTKPSLFNALDFPSYHTYQSVVELDWFLPINSEVFVRDKLIFPDWYDQVINDDYVINLILARSGPFHYMPDLMSVYRHHSSNESNIYANRILLNEKIIFILEKIKVVYPAESQSVFDGKIKKLQESIDFYKLEKKYPIRKYFRLKTYKKAIGVFLNITKRTE